MRRTNDNTKFMATLTVGSKGQIVIPKEIRNMFGIKPGDSVVLLADKERGIALQKASVMYELADAILSGKSGHDERIFAGELKELEKEE